MPVEYSSRLKEILGIKDTPYQGLAPQTQKGLMELDQQTKPQTPEPTPTPSTTQGGSFKEDYIKYFGQEAWDKKIRMMESKKPPPH